VRSITPPSASGPVVRGAPSKRLAGERIPVVSSAPFRGPPRRGVCRPADCSTTAHRMNIGDAQRARDRTERGTPRQRPSAVRQRCRPRPRRSRGSRTPAGTDSPRRGPVVCAAPAAQQIRSSGSRQHADPFRPPGEALTNKKQPHAREGSGSRRRHAEQGPGLVLHGRRVSSWRRIRPETRP